MESSAALAYSPVGTDLAYGGTTADMNAVTVVAGKRIASDPQVKDKFCPASFRMVFSPDGKHLARGVLETLDYSSGGIQHCAHVDVDGVAGPTFDRVEEIVFSADSQHVAYVANPDPNDGADENVAHAMVVADGKGGPFFVNVRRPVLSPTGDHVAYAALGRDASGKVEADWRMVLDGQEIPGYSVISPADDSDRAGALDREIISYQFGSDGVLEFLGEKDGVAYRVRCKP
jgi:hypothetical protein